MSEQVSKKACAKASVLRRIRSLIPLDVMGRLYQAYYLSHLELNDCCPLLLGVRRDQANNLEDTNNYILTPILVYG